MVIWVIICMILIGKNRIHWNCISTWSQVSRTIIESQYQKLEGIGIKKEDITITDSPEKPKIGDIVVEVFPYHLEIARVRTIRNDSFISGSLMTVELKADADGKYID